MSHPHEDPVVRHARREAIASIIIWFGAMTYTVGYCWMHAYDRTAEDLKFVLGIPDWVLWGVVLPWSVCVVICWWFAYVFMTDEPLGAESSLPDDDF